MPQLLPLRLLETVGLRAPAGATRSASDDDDAPALPTPSVTAPAATAPRASVPGDSFVEPSTDTGGPLDMDTGVEGTAPLSIIGARRIGESEVAV